uniref:Uncharacterized protein n=1 Tax=Arundo donax TaxID=35708 RepID=A0A0A9GZS3_ARUDO
MVSFNHRWPGFSKSTKTAQKPWFSRLPSRLDFTSERFIEPSYCSNFDFRSVFDSVSETGTVAIS